MRTPPTPPTPLIKKLCDEHPNPDSVKLGWGVDEHTVAAKSVRHAYLSDSNRTKYNTKVTALCGHNFRTGDHPIEGSYSQLCWEYGGTCRTCAHAAYWLKVRDAHPTFDAT